jgi:GTPase SAR1 family protein
MNKKANPSVVFSLHTKISFKLIVVGEKGVGKTTFINRYVK